MVVNKKTKTFYITKTRNTMGVLKSAMAYVSNHAATLFFGIGILALPFILFSISASISLTDSINSFDRILYYKEKLDKNAFILFILTFLIYAIGLAIYNLAINKHLVLTDVADDPKEKASIANLRKGFTGELKHSAGNFSIFFIGYFIVRQFLFYIFSLLDNYQPGYDTNSDAIIFYYLEQIFKYVPILIIVPLSFYMLFASLFICYRDNTDTTIAVKKVWEITRTKLKKTWLTTSFILVIALFLFSGLDRVFYFISIFSYSTHLYFALYILKTALSFIIIAYLQIANVVLFGSLEDEKEGIYLKRKIDEI